MRRRFGTSRKPQTGRGRRVGQYETITAGGRVGGLKPAEIWDGKK